MFKIDTVDSTSAPEDQTWTWSWVWRSNSARPIYLDIRLSCSAQSLSWVMQCNCVWSWTAAASCIAIIHGPKDIVAVTMDRFHWCLNHQLFWKVNIIYFQTMILTVSLIIASIRSWNLEPILSKRKRTIRAANSTPAACSPVTAWETGIQPLDRDAAGAGGRQWQG